MHAAKQRESRLKCVTLDNESNMSMLWEEEEFLEICSREKASEKAQEVEEKLPVSKHQQVRHSNNPESFFVDRSAVDAKWGSFARANAMGGTLLMIPRQATRQCGDRCESKKSVFFSINNNESVY